MDCGYAKLILANQVIQSSFAFWVLCGMSEQAWGAPVVSAALRTSRGLYSCQSSLRLVLLLRCELLVMLSTIFSV